jgi:two-component system CheB/CheR fusion protein
MSKPNKKCKFVIGLGASAGGLDALEQFLDHAPSDSGAAFIVVMHLSRDFKSMLDELLARHTKMEVKPAIDGTELQENTIYVIQPSNLLEVTGSQLRVEARPDAGQEAVATAVDVMFQSIARNWGKRGAGVVLSGSGSDGSRGSKAIREAGGFTAAQSPESAKFDPMPIAAIATECINAVESPDQLCRTVLDGLMMPLAAPASREVSEYEDAMAKIVNGVIGTTSIKAQEYKHSTFERRLSRRMLARRITNLTEYASLVIDDPLEAQALSQELLIGVTDFFRDQGPFKVISSRIIPEILKLAHQERRPARIWIAGCATGEEVYSIAMLFLEALREMPFEIDVQIFGTDVSKKHLDEATKGAYSKDRLSSVPPEMIERYFVKDDDGLQWKVIKRLRQMVVFAPHDLLSDPPFTKLDLICCRNVLIYFSVEAQQRVLGSFAFGLNHNSYLVLGSSETVGAQRDVFDFVDARRRIFRRTASLAPARSQLKIKPSYPAPMASKVGPSARLRGSELQPAYAAMLAEYAPPSLLMSEERELLHTFGNATNFLKAPTGVTSFDLAEMLDPAFKIPLVAAMERALKDDKPITFSKIELTASPHEGKRADLTVRPLERTNPDSPRFLLVSIKEQEEVVQPGDGETQTSIDADQLIAGRNDELELELNRTREALQSTIEENETANEELQASNEELMSANEELQSTNEELSSVNEELYSVNAEYHRQNDDLNRLTNDFDLLLNATQIGVLFLDDKCNISRFTGLAKRLFNLEESDVGRSLENFKSPFPNLELSEIVSQNPEVQILERETEDREGNPWLVRLVSDNDNFGLVLTFIDISELRDAEKELRQTYSMLSGIQKATNSFLLEVESDFRTVVGELGFSDFTGMDSVNLPHQLTFENVHQDDAGGLQRTIKNFAENHDADDKLEYIFQLFSHPHDEYRYTKMTGQRLENDKWQIVANDVDDQYRVELALREQRAILEAMVMSGRSLKAFVDQDGVFQFANDGFCNLIGKKSDEVLGKQIARVLPAQLYDQIANSLEATISRGEYESIIETPIDGEQSRISARYQAVEDNGASLGFVFDGINISELANFAQAFSSTDRILTAIVRRSELAFLLVGQEDGRVLFANAAGQEMLGLSEGEFEADKFRISRLTPEHGDELWEDHLGQAKRRGQYTLDSMLILDRVRNEHLADIYLELDRVDSQRPIVSVRVFENKRKTKQIEDLRSRSRQLTSSNRDLEQFTTAVAHDLRSPLRHITAFSDLLNKNLNDFSSEEIIEHSEVISKSAQQLSRMVGGLLEYARIGLHEGEMEECDLVDVFKTAQRNLADEITASKAKVSIEGNGSILGHRDLLTSLFQNLIANSISYARTGKAPRIKLDIREAEGGPVVRVIDNGIGIDPEFAERIFGLFRRLNVDDERSGLGIGLTNCRKIAEIHKYDLLLDTEVKSGSVFVFAPSHEK